ncbi:hypothetical protein D3C87_1988610 [compost metagenome]
MLFLKAHSNLLAVSDNRPFDQHAVPGQQVQLLFFTETRQLVLKTKVLIDLTACIKKLLQLKPAVRHQHAQFLGGRRLLSDMLQLQLMACFL